MARKNKKPNKRWGLFFILLAVMLICGFIYWKTILMEGDLNEKNQEKTIIEKQIEEEKRKNQELTDEMKYRQTDDYIKDKAKDAIGLRDPDETIFRPGDSD